MVGEIETRPSRLPFAKRVGNGFFKTALLAAGGVFLYGRGRDAGLGSKHSPCFQEKRRGHWKGAF